MEQNKFSLFNRNKVFKNNFTIKSPNMFPEVHDTFMEDPFHREHYSKIIEIFTIKDEPHDSSEAQMTDLPSYINIPSFPQMIQKFNLKYKIGTPR